MKRFQLSSMYITLLLVSMLVGFLVTLIDRGASSTLTSPGISAAAGAGLATFVVSSVFPTFWILFARQRRRATYRPTLLGIMIAVGFAALSMRGVSLNNIRVQQYVVFSPEGCGHSVRFPGVPEYQKLEAGGTTFYQANHFSADSFLRAECIPMKHPPKTHDLLTELIKKFAQREGLSSVSTWIETKPDGTYAHARGNKMVTGKWVTYNLIVVVSDRSLLSLSAGARSGTYPTAAIARFNASVTPN